MSLLSKWSKSKDTKQLEKPVTIIQYAHDLVLLGSMRIVQDGTSRSTSSSLERTFVVLAAVQKHVVVHLLASTFVPVERMDLVPREQRQLVSSNYEEHRDDKYDDGDDSRHANFHGFPLGSRKSIDAHVVSGQPEQILIAHRRRSVA